MKEQLTAFHTANGDPVYNVKRAVDELCDHIKHNCSNADILMKMGEIQGKLTLSREKNVLEGVIVDLCDIMGRMFSAAAPVSGAATAKAPVLIDPFAIGATAGQGITLDRLLEGFFVFLKEHKKPRTLSHASANNYKGYIKKVLLRENIEVEVELEQLRAQLVELLVKSRSAGNLSRAESNENSAIEAMLDYIDELLKQQ